MSFSCHYIPTVLNGTLLEGTRRLPFRVSLIEDNILKQFLRFSFGLRPQGELVAIKRLHRDSVHLTRDILIEMKKVSR